MLTKLRKSQTEGFTIIEVMIVLAVAALILLIVLLAVPALQRNARNTTVKNDVGTVAGAINTSESDNNGTPPTSVSGTGTVTLANGTSETIKVSGGDTVSNVVATGAAPASVPVGNITVFDGHTCAGAANPRAFALYYSTETSGATALQCTDS